MACAALQKLLMREDTLSELSAVKQDAKHFQHRMMVMERQKRATLVPLYAIAKALLPNLDISQRNIDYYASLANYYTIYHLRRLKPGQICCAMRGSATGSFLRTWLTRWATT